MTETTIEWTDTTWNPVAGCTIVSPGCSNCYAMRMAARLQAMGLAKYSETTRQSGSRSVWTGRINLDRRALEGPLRWRRPRRVFVNSMSDLFHESVPEDFIREVWDVMRNATQHEFQILTKRPERAANLLSRSKFSLIPNAWLGTSVETADFLHRIESLRHANAAIRFLSIEPLLGPVGKLDLTDIHWVIVGGESGPKARPMRRDWVDEIHDQCINQGVAFFFKQWGGTNKKRSGRMYRGRTWDDFPTLNHSP